MKNGTICGKVKVFLSSPRSIMTLKSLQRGDFSSSPVVKTSPSNAGGAGSIPGWGTKIPNAVWMQPKKKKRVFGKALDFCFLQRCSSLSRLQKHEVHYFLHCSLLSSTPPGSSDVFGSRFLFRAQ